MDLLVSFVMFWGGEEAVWGILRLGLGIGIHGRAHGS